MSQDLEENYKALEALLTDKNLFSEVVKAVFNTIDKDNSGSIELSEIDLFIKGICEDMGITQIPDKSSISSVFSELDTDKSKNISEVELGEFLRLLFEQQKKQIESIIAKKD